VPAGGVVRTSDLRDPRIPFIGRSPGQGETELGALSLGERFWIPDQAAADRLRGYQKAERLLDVDNHYGLYRETFPGAKALDESNWIPVDFPGMMARLVRHYAFGEDFSVRARRQGSQPQIDRIYSHSGFRSLASQVAESLPVLGDAVLRVDIEDVPEDEVSDVSGTELIPQAVIRYVHPGHFFPDFDPLDGTQVNGVTLAWVLPTPSGMEGLVGMPMLVLREIHTLEEGDDGRMAGQVAYRLNAWDGHTTGEEVAVSQLFPDLEDGPTGIDEIPIVHIGYNRMAGKFFGRSEFQRILRIVLALENRFGQEDEALERHARPKLIVGPGVLDERGQARLADFDVIEIDPSVLEKAIKPEYLTWDMQIGGIQHEIEKLEEYLFMTTETSPASFGLERDGSQVESARALRFKAHRTVNKIIDLRQGELEDDIRRLFRVAQKLELAARTEDDLPAYTRTAIDMVWPDPIIEDQSAEVIDYSTLKGAHLVSRRRAVGDLFQLDPRAADREVQEILQDMVDESAAASVARPAGPGATGEEFPEAGSAPPPGAPAPGEQPPEGVTPGETA